MTAKFSPAELDEYQKGQIYGALSVGCDRQTAAHAVGCSRADIRRAMQRDPEFAANLVRAEAGCELKMMQAIFNKAKEKNEWRAAVWWLEQRSPERFLTRRPDSVTPAQLKTFVEILVDLLHEELPDAAERQGLMTRLRTISNEIQELTLGETLNLSENQNLQEDDGGLDPAD